MAGIQYDFGKGIILYWDFPEGNIDTTCPSQIELLKEDLAQIFYSDRNIIMDIGWYPSFSVNGYFRVLLILNHNWDNPIASENFYTFDELLSGISLLRKRFELQ